MADRILVVDDDDDIAELIRFTLEDEGFDIIRACTGKEALLFAANCRPDLIVLDVMMPEMTGVEVCERLREDAVVRHTPVIMLTAMSELDDQVEALAKGADDYVIKPFDPRELVARIKSNLLRSRERVSANPLTSLPGNLQIQSEITLRINQQLPFALMYVDLDHFKAYNDHYGFARGDEVLKRLAECLVEVVASFSSENFIGHVGGDDFVVVLAADQAQAAAEALIKLWDAAVLELFDPEDRERGYIEVADRQNQPRRYPPCSLSIGLTLDERQRFSSHWKASESASEMKSLAKQTEGSCVEVDRRT